MTRARHAGRRRARGTPTLPWTARLGLGALGIAGVALGFELLPRTGWVSIYLPPTSAMLEALGREAVTAAFWQALLDTVVGWALGLAIAVAAGAVAGVVIGSGRGLRASTASTIEFLRPIPSVALIPVAMLLYGARLGSTLLDRKSVE